MLNFALHKPFRHRLEKEIWNVNTPKCINYFASIILALSAALASQQTTATEQASISREQAIEVVKSQYPGKALKVSQKGTIYVVKLLTKDGKVKHVRVDGITGELK